MDFYWKEVPGGTYCITHYTGHEKHVEFPKHLDISILHDDIFKGNTVVESIVIPETVKEIGGFFLDGCINVKHIQLPQGLENMWHYAFVRSSLVEIEIPGTVNSIACFTFFDCKKLKKVVINEGVKKIMGSSFKGCTALTNVYLPSTIESIHEDAFIGCNEIKFH